MNKKYPLVLVATALLSLPFFTPSTQASAAVPIATAPNATETQLSIVGKAVQQVAPNYAVLTLGLETKAPTVSQAKSQNDATMSALIAGLLKLNIPKHDIVTTNFSVSPNYTYKDGKEIPQSTMYTVNNEVTVKITDLKKVSTVIDMASSNGAGTINSLHFFNDRTQAMDDTLLREAVVNARHQATVLASALGLSIQGVKAVSIAPTYTENISPNTVFLARSLSTNTPIEQGQLKISKSVSITYLLGK